MKIRNQQDLIEAAQKGETELSLSKSFLEKQDVARFAAACSQVTAIKIRGCDSREEDRFLDYLCPLPNLEDLTLDERGLISSPEKIAALPTLKRVHTELHGWFGSPEIFHKVVLFPRLTSLRIEEPDIVLCPTSGHHRTPDDDDYQILSKSKSLTSLTLARPLFDATERALDHLAALKQLRELQIDYCEATDEVLKSWEALTSLEKLIMAGGDYGDAGLRSLSTLPNLVHLGLILNDKGAFRNFTLETLKEVCQGGFHRLCHLHLHGDIVRNPVVEQVGQLGNLTSLALEWGRLTGHIAPILSQFTRLERLSLSTAFSYQSHDAVEVCTHIGCLTHLRELDLNCCFIDDLAFKQLIPLANLESLNLSCNRVTGEGLSHLLHFPHLHRLDLGNSSQLKGRDLREFAPLSSLRYLDLSSCPNLTDEGLEAIADLPNLEYLDLARSPQITDRGVEALSHLPNLKYLDLTHCNLITNRSIQALGKLPKLRHLSLRWCLNVTDEGARALARLTTLVDLEVTLLPVYDKCLREIQASNPDCVISGWKGRDERPPHLANK